jgi:ATP-binding cassette subfamily F protein 3
VRSGAPVVYEGDYDSFVRWQETHHGTDTGSGVSKSALPNGNKQSRDMDKERKRRDGDLRNRYYKARAPLEKRLSELEIELPRSERELHEANLLLSSPDHYSNATLVMETVERKKMLEERIEALNCEWERVFAQLEEARGNYEQQRERVMATEP